MIKKSGKIYSSKEVKMRREKKHWQMWFTKKYKTFKTWDYILHYAVFECEGETIL